LAEIFTKFVFPPLLFGTQEKKSIAKRNPLNTLEAICSSINGGLLIQLTPQATISSYCHFAFQNARILSFIMIPFFFVK